MPQCVALEAAALDPLEFAFALICVLSITLPVSIDMLQIHSYNQLAHGVVIILTTVEGRCEKNQLLTVLSSSWLFNPVYLRKGKTIRTKP